jgi:hypothetical protein
MSNTKKELSNFDHQQTLRASFNDVDNSITTGSYLTGKVGRKVTQTISTTTVANDTLTFSYTESAVLLYQIQVIYTDATYATMISAERIS